MWPCLSALNNFSVVWLFFYCYSINTLTMNTKLDNDISTCYDNSTFDKHFRTLNMNRNLTQQIHSYFCNAMDIGCCCINVQSFNCIILFLWLISVTVVRLSDHGYWSRNEEGVWPQSALTPILIAYTHLFLFTIYVNLGKMFLTSHFLRVINYWELCTLFKLIHDLPLNLKVAVKVITCGNKLLIGVPSLYCHNIYLTIPFLKHVKQNK